MNQDQSSTKSREDNGTGIPMQLKLMLGVLGLAVIALFVRLFGIV